MNLFNLFTYAEGVQMLLLACYSTSLSLVGTFLFLRKKSMIANAISHTVLFGIAILFIVMKVFFKVEHFQLLSLNIGVYVAVSLLTAAVTIFCIEGLKKYTLLKNDASTAYVFSTLFAVGAILITLFTKSSHVGIDIIMGNMDLIHMHDLYAGIAIVTAVSLFIYLFFEDLIVIAFDKTLVHFSLKRGAMIQALFLFLTSLVITSGFRFIGIAPVLGLIIIPPVTASLFSRSVKELIYFSVISNICIVFLSIMMTKIFYLRLGIGLSTSGMLVTMQFALLLFFLSKKKLKALL